MRPARGGILRRIVPAALLVVLTLAVFLPVGGNSFVNVDDGLYVTKNPMVLRGITLRGLRWAFTTMHAANWHPLTWISHMLDVRMFGIDPGKHHLTSLALHAGASLLLYLLILGLLGDATAAFLAAGLFALHPLRVESVAWISQRKDVLATFLALLSLALYLRYLRLPGTGRYLAVLACGGLAMMAKPTAVSLPLLMLVIDWWPLGRLLPRLRAVLLEKVPLLVLSGGASWLTFEAQKRGGAMALMDQEHLGVRLGNALLSPLLYLGKTVYPTGLIYFYPLRPQLLTQGKVLAAGTFAVLVCLAAWRWRRRAPWLGASWLWFLAALLPMAGIVKVGTIALADRYAYIPAAGISLGLAGWFSLRRSLRFKLVAAFTMLVAMALVAPVTRSQILVWRDSVSLARHALAVDPENEVACLSLGSALVDEGRLDEARRVLTGLAERRPENATVFYTLGLIAERSNDPRGAEQFYRRTIAVDPRYADALNNLGVLFSDSGRMTEALELYRRAIEADPSLAEPRYNLALDLAAIGRGAEAVPLLREVLRIDPWHRGALELLRRLG